MLYSFYQSKALDRYKYIIFVSKAGANSVNLQHMHVNSKVDNYIICNH